MATSNKLAGTQAQRNAFAGIILLPLLNGLGHLPPALGGTWAALGTRKLNPPVLVLLFSVHGLVDIGDKYKDLPRHARPSSFLVVPWAILFGATALLATYACGLSTAIQLLRFLALEVLWSCPIIPVYSHKSGLRYVKLKRVLGVFKSVFCGYCNGLMDTNTITYHTCSVTLAACSAPGVRATSLAYSMLYNFVRETICDVRDIEEDTHEGLITLPVVLGHQKTLVLLAVTTFVGEYYLSGGFTSEGLLRATLTITASAMVAAQPREKTGYWAFLTTFGLTPAWWAQAGLM